MREEKERERNIGHLLERLKPRFPFEWIVTDRILKTYLGSGRLPKFLRRPTLLTETKEDKALWGAWDGIDKYLSYVRTKEALNRVRRILHLPIDLVEIVNILKKTNWYNATKPLRYLRARAMEKIIGVYRDSETISLETPLGDASKEPLTTSIKDPRDPLEETDSLIDLIDLERRCTEIGLNEFARKAYLFKTKYQTSFAEAYRQLGLPAENYSAAEKDLERKRHLL
jgi:hypothetical protein